MLEDYRNDPIAADGIYKGERLCFYGIGVEEVTSFDWPGTESGIVKSDFFSYDIKFIPSGGVTSSKMQLIEPGHILNIVGECRGFDDTSGGIIIIKSCWVEGVNVNLGTQDTFNPY